MRTALVYDRVNKWGGAERVLLALHEMFPDAPLYTSVYDARRAPWAKIFPKIYTSFLQRIPFAKGNHEFLGTFMPLAFESFDFSNYDLVISVTSEAAEGIITKPSTKHICICLTPTRYLWSGHDFYFKNPFLRFFSRPAVWYLKKWARIAANRPDLLFAISTSVAQRTERYYNRQSKVIYPPVDTKNYESESKNYGKKEYYLVVSRLVPYKRVDLVVEAFNRLKLPLVIVGTGKEKFKLKLMAKNNIKFVGEITEKQLVGYLQGAKALIMPQEEDFGIVAVEAQATGTPVIAYKKGGALDTVIEERTGVFFGRQTDESLIKAINRLNGLVIRSEDCIKNARRFSKEEFKQKFSLLTKETSW